MKKYYEEAKYNAAFDRCVDVMSQMLQKYGHQVLDKLEQDTRRKWSIPRKVIKHSLWRIRLRKISQFTRCVFVTAML